MSRLTPDCRTWVEGADAQGFGIHNLPWGRRGLEDGQTELISRLGNFAVSIRALAHAELVSAKFGAMKGPIELTVADARELREHLIDLFHVANASLSGHEHRDHFLVPLADVNLLLPIRPPAFTDFYSGIHHASNVGRMFRPEQPPLLPNYRHLPVAYSGRASTVQLTGEPVIRPAGQTKGKDDPAPTFGPSRELDFELEVGVFLAANATGVSQIPVSQAEEYILGLVLLNDWSARDVQRWEYQPLGPFLAKSFATSISPWIVSLEALDFARQGPTTEQDPAPLPHLASDRESHFDVGLEVVLKPAGESELEVISRSNLNHLYWSVAQQLAHMSSNGCRLEAGELYGTGTISGPEPESRGSLLELTWNRTEPLKLAGGAVTRTYLEDGDTLCLRGAAQKEGITVSLGEVCAEIRPAKP